MHFQTTVAEIWSALLILFDMLKNAVCIPCLINDNFESEACSSRPQQLFIDPLAIQWPPIDPVTIYRPLGQSNWLLGVDIDHFENYWASVLCNLDQCREWL